MSPKFNTDVSPQIFLKKNQLAGRQSQTRTNSKFTQGFSDAERIRARYGTLPKHVTVQSSAKATTLARGDPTRKHSLTFEVGGKDFALLNIEVEEFNHVNQRTQKDGPSLKTHGQIHRNTLTARQVAPS